METGDLSSGVTFTATTEGTGPDNPSDPDNLTFEQRKKTFIGIYLDVNKFKLTFTVSEGKGGRNFMFSGQSVADGAPEVSEECTSGSCVIWGDPHIITFDLHQEHLRLHPKRESLFRTRNWELDELSVQENGTFWVVKSSNVHIQGRYGKNKKHSDLTSLDAFAVGGPFLNYNVLVFRPLSGAVTWNNLEILSSLPAAFTNRFVSARYHKGAEMVKDGSMAPAIEVNLPRGLKLTINRWATMLEAKIDMCLEEGQDGQCGNFNDNVTDDSEEQIMTRIGQKLLPHECMIERFPEHMKMIHIIPDYASKGVVPESHDAKNASEIELATQIPEEKHIEASTDAPPECRDWCETHMDAWVKKCAWGSLVCSTCEACVMDQGTHNAKNATDIEFVTPNASEEQGIKAVPECRNWCASHMDAWDKKCAWDSLVCSTCEACPMNQEMHDAKNASDIEVVTPSASEEQGNKAVPECRNWCETHMDAWDKKCAWDSLVCSTCEACAANQKTYDTKSASKIDFVTPNPSEEKRVEASTEAVPGCRDWCGWALDAWDKKCGWPSLVCSTCEECVKENYAPKFLA
jgi:hypothetical protein